MVRKAENGKSTDLVKESHCAVGEIGKVRADFNRGKLGAEQASVYIGLFNATSRILNTAIHAERWVQQQTERSKSLVKNSK